MQNCLQTMEPSSGFLVGVCAIRVDRLNRRIVLLWISIQGYELFNLGMNKSVPGVKLTAVGMKWQFPRYEKNEQEVWNWIVLVWNRIPKGMKIHSLKVWKYTQKVWNDVEGMKKYQWYQGMKQMHKVWKTAQGMKNVPKVYNSSQKVWNAFSGMKRVFSWKTVGFHTFMGLFHTFLGMKKIAVFPWCTGVTDAITKHDAYVASKTFTPSNITKWVSTVEHAWAGWRNTVTDPEHMSAVELVSEILSSDNEDWKTWSWRTSERTFNMSKIVLERRLIPITNTKLLALLTVRKRRHCLKNQKKCMTSTTQWWTVHFYSHR
jgi:hypothetical protein